MKVKDVYSLKMLYFNAGKNLLSDNRRYYTGLVSAARIDSVADSIDKLKGNNMNIMLTDSAAAAADAVLNKIAADYRDSIVYCFEDDEIFNTVSAVYIPCENFFIYSDKWGNFSQYLSLSLYCCYNHSGCRSHSPKQCLDIAGYYYGKTECIENKSNL